MVSACTVFRRIAPYLKRRKIGYKAPRSLHELQRLNSGIYYGFSQVGKFVTVYPESARQALQVARALDRLTRGQPAPQVPYDRRLRPGSCVHYRFGGFNPRVRVRVGKKLVPALRRPDGTLVPDRREPESAVPPWLEDPFRWPQPNISRPFRPTPLETDYADFAALVQRGRGGVYRAVDRSTAPPRACIIKEGRRHGETDWHGRDGYHRIRNEARILTALGRVTAAVPRLRRTFRARGSFHLVMDQVGGRSLQQVIAGRAPMSRRRTLTYCRDMSRIVAAIHAAGWAWADCKPNNFICTGAGRLRALDFEAAHRTGDPRPPDLGTPGYGPPRRDPAHPQAADLFALGACIAQLVTRRAQPPKLRRRPRRQGAWRQFPPALAELAWQLLGPDPRSRPSARAAARRLEALRAATD